MLYDKAEIRKALVTLAIEKTLLDIGKPAYDKVVNNLNSKNHYLPDCYDHPEYLNETLSEIYGNSAHAIVESITEQLEEFNYHKPIKRFLKVICH